MTKKVLIIDDDPLIVSYLEILLNDNGYETATANDGVEAVEMALSLRPDVIDAH